MAIIAAEALLGRDFHEKTFIRSFNLHKCTGVKLQTHVWKSPVQAVTNSGHILYGFDKMGPLSSSHPSSSHNQCRGMSDS